MTYQEIVWQILAGGLLGMLGQGLRAVAGMKKISEDAQAQGKTFGDLFSANQLMISLFIGFTAGALSLVATALDGKPAALDSSTISAVVAAGYAGTDFIEAFLSKIPGGDSANRASAPPARPPAMG